MELVIDEGEQEKKMGQRPRAVKGLESVIRQYFSHSESLECDRLGCDYDFIVMSCQCRSSNFISSLINLLEYKGNTKIPKSYFAKTTVESSFLEV